MEIVDVKYLGSDGQYQTYVQSDKTLINTAFITPSFGTSDDYIEYFIKDYANVVLSSNYYNTKYNVGSDVDPVTGTTSTLYLGPVLDAKSAGYDRGIVNVKYNFFRKYLLSSPNPQQNFWIKEVSNSRTEIKVARQDLSNLELANAFSQFNAALGADAYYPDFLLNFGADKQIIGINAVYVEEAGNAYVIFKLYEPLPLEFDTKSTFWVVTETANPAEFNVSINVEPEKVIDYTQIKGPNFKVLLNDTISQTTPYYTYESLFLTSVSSSYQQLKSMMDEKGIQINVQYDAFENFIHFSSATERLYNFTYKVQQIESASAGLSSTNTDSAKVLLQANIDNIITKFDGYEYYLYFSSASAAWPKRTSTLPYVLYSVTSSQVVNWLGSPDIMPTATTMSMFYSSSTYDNANKDLLQYSTPSYIRDDSGNQPYLVFLNMIGQHFDNIWIYLKDVTNRYSAENNPFVGISMDQVGDALKGLGITLYTNTSISDNIYYSLLGVNADGSLLPPTGSEVITNYVTSSIATLPGTQITDEVYKRLYHNLAYLLKTKGTERGVRALVTTFGIPNDILSVKEFGGYNIYSVAGIQEIANNKIITGSVRQISSSLLSPNVTLQYYENNMDKSSIDLQVGFSPADSINASITSSGLITSSLQPGYFNIMQYIGAPDLQYSSSYVPLVTLGNTYFKAEYTDRYNVWDFIRIIKYYNNSLFKMLKDFVPARSSTTTGIIVKSHMLERNKYPRHEPTATTSSMEADYLLLTVSGSDGGSVIGSTAFAQGIPIQYSAYSAPLSGSLGTVFMSSSDDVQKFTGEFSGSVIQADFRSFSQEEVSSYVYPWTSSVAPSLHGGQNIMYLTYSVSPLYENVYSAVTSQKFLDLDYNGTQLAPTNYGLVTKSIDETVTLGAVYQSEQPYSQYAQIQDFNYYSRPSVIPRYSGSYLSGLHYNTQSSGDISYGTDPVINYYTDKLGLFTQVATSSFLPGRVNATLAYLADVSGGLFELNQNNKHWQDIQNIFKAGTSLTIKQFDNKKYSNQKQTDGIKTIYNSGYSYSPQLYFNVKKDIKTYFMYTGDSAVSNFIAYNNEANAFISGTVGPSYPVTLTDPLKRTGYIYDIFDSSSPSVGYTAGSSGGSIFPRYTTTQAGIKTFTVDFEVTLEFEDPADVPHRTHSGSYAFGAYLNGSTLIGDVQGFDFTSSYTAPAVVDGTIDKYPGNLYPWDNNPTTSGPYALANGPFIITTSGGSPSAPIGSSTSQITASYYDYTIGGAPYTSILITDMSADLYATGLRDYTTPRPTVLIEMPIGASVTPVSSTYIKTSAITYTTPGISLGSSDYVEFKFRQGDMSTVNYTASVSKGLANSLLTVGSVNVGQGGYPYASSDGGHGSFINELANIGTLQGDIILSENLSQYLGYQFVPYFQSASVLYTSSLYTSYGDINYSFNPEEGDKIVMSDFGGITQEFDVLSYQLIGGKMNISVVPQILTNWVSDPSLIYKFLLLRRYKDEQNVIVTYNKLPGQTSYGFTIPDTINPNVTANINTLQAAVQSQLLSSQSEPVINTLNGGTFGG